jgi:hypothetical protein
MRGLDRRFPAVVFAIMGVCQRLEEVVRCPHEVRRRHRVVTISTSDVLGDVGASEDPTSQYSAAG